MYPYFNVFSMRCIESSSKSDNIINRSFIRIVIIYQKIPDNLEEVHIAGKRRSGYNMTINLYTEYTK